MQTMQPMNQLVQRLKQIKREKRRINPAYFRDDKPIQLVVRNKPRPITFFRAKPETAYNPTIPQIKARLRFSELAKKAREKKFTGDIPPAAEMVKLMKNERFGRTAKAKKWEIILAHYLEG